MIEIQEHIEKRPLEFIRLPNGRSALLFEGHTFEGFETNMLPGQLFNDLVSRFQLRDKECCGKDSSNTNSTSL